MTPQSQIAHYRITSKLGEGGMGAVYRATDTKLNREVAIKVLPPAFAEDADRMARFTREAQVLASLNHPNIAAIYGVEQGAIVMELVDGEDLRGPMPVDAAIGIARQIAAGLEAAHEKGIVHRDLKPANIKVANDGTVKLLDFGLAKASEATAAAVGSNTQSPTMSLAMTQAGMILGTAAYMSPEQARGKPVDKRADIWAFGVILYELLTGASLFGGGETVSDSLAAVITKEPDLAPIPEQLRPLLKACLEKDPRNRLRDIGDWQRLVNAPSTAATARAATSAKLPWTIAALGLAAAAVLAGILWLKPRPADPLVTRFALEFPAGTSETVSTAATQFVPSPDGRLIAFIAVDDNGSGKSFLWVRRLGSPAPHKLEKTDGAVYPFWSPDSRFIAFFAQGSLKKLPADGGSPQQICTVAREDSAGSTIGDGGTWNQDNVIVFGVGSRRGAGLLRVPASGGVAIAATTLDNSAGENWHSWPQFLPDGRHVLYFAHANGPGASAVYVQELGSAKRTLVMKNDLHAVWSPPGYLLYPRESTLFAQPFDLKSFRLTGEPVSLVEDITMNAANGRAAFGISQNGVLVYRGGAVNRQRQLVWFSREGKRLGIVGKADGIGSVRLSPDEKNLEVSMGVRAVVSLWTMDLATGAVSRTTDEANTSLILGPWSPDSARIAVNKTSSQGVLDLTVASGKTSPLLPAGFYAMDWSPDGRTLLCSDLIGTRLSILPLPAGGPPQTISDQSYGRSDFRFSPDGRSLVFASEESGRSQITLVSFPSFAEKRQVSVDGGTNPAWRKDGKEIIFRAPDNMLMSVEIRAGAKLEAGVPKPLFRLPADAGRPTFTVSSDGQRVLVGEPVQQTSTVEYITVVNWTAELKQR